jgi:hypothetical protein
MMTVSAIALSAYAENDDDNVGVVPNTQLWFADTALSVEYQQTLDINGVSYNFTLGDNTIQKYAYGNNAYEVFLHPQFFAPYTTTPNYDDSANAQYEHNITDVFVYTPDGEYVSCLVATGELLIPEEYALPKEQDLYFQCKIYSSIVSITGKSLLPNWNGQTVYLEINPD